MRISLPTWQLAQSGNVFCKRQIANERIRRIENFRRDRPFDQWLVHMMKRVKHPTYWGRGL